MIKPITEFPTWVYKKIEGGIYRERPAFTLLRIVQLKDSKFGKMYIYNTTIEVGKYSRGIIKKERAQYYSKHIEEYFSLLSKMFPQTKKNLFKRLFK